MAVRVGINGFGRIGRSFYRAILARGAGAGVELVAVNDPFGDSETMAFLLKHDSVGGTLPNEVKLTDGGFSVDGKEIRKLESRDPGEIRSRQALTTVPSSKAFVIGAVLVGSACAAA